MGEFDTQRWWYMGHDRLSMEGWENIFEASVNLIAKNDRLSTEGWKNVCAAWVR